MSARLSQEKGEEKVRELGGKSWHKSFTHKRRTKVLLMFLFPDSHSLSLLTERLQSCHPLFFQSAHTVIACESDAFHILSLVIESASLPRPEKRLRVG